MRHAAPYDTFKETLMFWRVQYPWIRSIRSLLRNNVFIFWIGYLKYKLQVGIRPDYCPWYYIKAYGLYLLSRMFVGVLFEQIRGHQKCAWRGHVRSMSARCVHVLETVVGQGLRLNVESCSCQGVGYLFLR